MFHIDRYLRVRKLTENGKDWFTKDRHEFEVINVHINGANILALC